MKHNPGRRRFAGRTLAGALNERDGAVMADGFSVHLVDCTNTLLDEIAIPTQKRKDIAQTYALAIKSGEAVDWAKVNAAIIKRWSVGGLKWIKESAWSGRCWN